MERVGDLMREFKGYECADKIYHGKLKASSSDISKEYHIILEECLVHAYVMNLQSHPRN